MEETGLKRTDELIIPFENTLRWGVEWSPLDRKFKLFFVCKVENRYKISTGLYKEKPTPQEVNDFVKTELIKAIL